MSDPEHLGQETYPVFEKAQTVDPEIRAYVYSLITALGGTGVSENGDYVLGDDGLGCLRDLKRWLKVYDEKNNRLDVARCLAEADLVNGDILPILKTWTEDDAARNNRSKLRIALACLELLVPLTWPLENVGEMTVNHHRHVPYIRQAQVRYKAGILAFGQANILRTVVRIGVPSIAVSREDRTSRDEGIIKLMLYFLRNITVIAAAPNLPSQGLDNEISRSATIEAFRQQDVFALVLTMCSNMGSEFNLQDVILLDIIFNLIRGVKAEHLFMNEKQRQTQKTTDLKDALGKEKGMHRDYAKVAPTRHGRFGTMIWVKREDEKMSTVSGQDNLKDGRNSLLKMDKSKKWSKPQQRRKDLSHSIHDFDRSVRLNGVASELLRNFVDEFLDSGFNPLFSHLRKAIEREADRLLDINYRQFFYTVSWFLQAERYRRMRQRKDRANQKVQTDFEAESYDLVAAVLNQETFIALNRYMQASLDNKEWQDLNASMKCFTQILLTVQEMAQSPLEDDQEIADNIQNRIFYEETTHDRIATILKSYKDQGFGYLDACTELSHVFLRMLERYSKENTDLQVRSRRRARRKKREERAKSRETGVIREDRGPGQKGGEDGDEDGQSEAEDMAEAAQVTKERRFDFARFAAKFSSQSCVNTFIAFTAFHRDLSVDQLKRAHRFFHRVAFKQDLAVLLFRVDIMALFYKMIKGPEGLDREHAMFKEWDELVRQVLRKLFRKLEQRPELMVEMLFSKIRATLFYLEHGHDYHTAATKRVAAEVEVKPAPGRDIEEQIGIVVAALLKDAQEELVRWVLDSVSKAADERRAWELRALAEQDPSDPHDAGIDTALAAREANPEESTSPSIVLRAPNDKIRTSTTKNAKSKLLLRLCGFENSGPESSSGTPWVIPSTLTSNHLQDLHTTIEKYLATAWSDPHGNTEPDDLLRRIGQGATVPAHNDDDDGPRRDAFIDDSEGSDDVQDFMFPANVRSKSDVLDSLKQRHRKRKLLGKRKSTEDDDGDDDGTLDQDLLDERRRAREQAAADRRRKIKSELYIRDSDEEMDEEENRAFFAREEENQRRQANRVFNALRSGESVDDVGKMVKDRKRKMHQALDSSDQGKSGGNQKERRKRKKQGGREGRHEAENEIRDGGDAMDVEVMDGDLSTSSPSSAPSRTPSTVSHHHPGDIDDEEHEGGDTPLSSQSHDQKTDLDKEASTALQEISQPRVRHLSNTVPTSQVAEGINKGQGQEHVDLDSAPQPPSSPVPLSSRMQKQRVRAGFILEDSDDE